MDLINTILQWLLFCVSGYVVVGAIVSALFLCALLYSSYTSWESDIRPTLKNLWRKWKHAQDEDVQFDLQELIFAWYLIVPYFSLKAAVAYVQTKREQLSETVLETPIDLDARKEKAPDIVSDRLTLEYADEYSDETLPQPDEDLILYN
jgi:hypothetical protein